LGTNFEPLNALYFRTEGVYIRLSPTEGGKNPQATIPAQISLQQSIHLERQFAYGGERGCKIAYPLSSKASGRA
jgi:hypothetical protein